MCFNTYTLIFGKGTTIIPIMFIVKPKNCFYNIFFISKFIDTPTISFFITPNHMIINLVKFNIICIHNKLLLSAKSYRQSPN